MMMMTGRGLSRSGRNRGSCETPTGRKSSNLVCSALPCWHYPHRRCLDDTDGKGE